MLDKLRRLKRVIVAKHSMQKAYGNDCTEYSKWQYNNPAVKTKNAMEAKILRQTHILEKGMSLSKPRAGFGVQKACELIDFITAFISEGYKVEESVAVKNAIGVLDAYIRFHAERGFTPDEVIRKYDGIRAYLGQDGGSHGVVKTSLEELKNGINGTFPAFFNSRHSVRQFADRPVSAEDIEKAVALAMHAPSACNRQSCKVYFYQDKETNQKLGKLIAGNTGFDEEVQHYLVVTSDMSAFYDAFERNQTYVDGGIFAMALAEALHYYGIANCILQNGEFKERNARFREICGNIPENEKIILFIAIGYYKDEFSYAVSRRKELNEVLTVK